MFPSASFLAVPTSLPSESFNTKLNCSFSNVLPVNTFVASITASPVALYVFSNLASGLYVTFVSSVPFPLSVTFTVTVTSFPSYVYPSAPSFTSASVYVYAYAAAADSGTMTTLAKKTTPAGEKGPETTALFDSVTFLPGKTKDYSFTAVENYSTTPTASEVKNSMNIDITGYDS